jgi:hypothetical protein
MAERGCVVQKVREQTMLVTVDSRVPHETAAFLVVSHWTKHFLVPFWMHEATEALLGTNSNMQHARMNLICFLWLRNAML